ncbi:hypothetical protein [Puniceicoccus vermicola]|uniref:Uncharacterized protein n=1 Tax=Puniceicoccus vermicola TaxID=388746 RepID=A0A7X1E3R5_9BACT|nr:hypothetical protein [Puniceicoccus vermicola]MBC2601341.1 hypothetical protein [Puniceicoccus vermicola]
MMTLSPLRNVPRVFLLLICLPLIASAGSLREADEDDWARLYRIATTPNSAYRVAYIGESRGRIYVEYYSAIHSSSLFADEGKTIVYWLPKEEADPEQLQEMIEQKNAQTVKRQDSTSTNREPSE